MRRFTHSFRSLTTNSNRFNAFKLQQLIEEEKEKEKEIKIDIITGNSVTNKKSKFVAHVATVHNEFEVKHVLSKLYADKKIASATHNIRAFRIRNTDGTLVTFDWLQAC